MQKKLILIFGTGHLVYRLKKLLPNNGYEVMHSSIENLQSLSESGLLLENIEIYLGNIDLDKVKMVYLLDDKDENNLQLIVSFISFHSTIPITASLFNENLIPHLEVSHNNVTILNPAKLAAPFFVSTIYKKLDRENNIPAPIVLPKKYTFLNSNKLIRKLLIAFIIFVTFSVCFFHYYEKLSWINALYFTIVTITTVGYGDINLLNSSHLSKVFGITLMISSTVFIWTIFSLYIDELLKSRLQLELGRKKYNYSDHIVLCGLGRLGYFIVEELSKRKEKIIIIEENEDVRYINYCKMLGAKVYIGDARLQQVLMDVNIEKAKVLLSVVSNDTINLEIGLNARTLKPGLKLILRIFDERMAKKINDYLNIELTLSASNIVARNFYDVLDNTEV